MLLHISQYLKKNKNHKFLCFFKKIYVKSHFLTIFDFFFKLISNRSVQKNLFMKS